MTKNLLILGAGGHGRVVKEIAEALKTYNRNSIPLYIYYKEGSRQPIYLPQILTTDILQKKLK